MAKPSFTLKIRVASTIVVCLLGSVGTAATQAPAKAVTPPAQASADLPAGTPQSWADDAVRHEI
jgi:hypothetical protein